MCVPRLLDGKSRRESEIQGRSLVPESPERPSKPPKGWGRLASLGFEFTAAVAGFVLVGYWIDRHYGTYPRWILIGAVLGIVGGMYNLIRAALRVSKGAGEAQRKTNGDKNR